MEKFKDIQTLLKSELTSNSIAYDSDVSWSTIDELRDDKYQIDELPKETITKLEAYAKLYIDYTKIEQPFRITLKLTSSKRG